MEWIQFLRMVKYNPDVKLLRKDVGNVLVWVKFHGVPITTFSEDGLSSIATKLGTLLMLDSYTSNMCMQSWGRSSYARAMIELRAIMKLYNIVVVMPNLIGEGFYMCTIRVEYEWKPHMCSSCKVLENQLLSVSLLICLGKHDCVEMIPSGDENPIRTLRDYSKPSHEGYRNTIELHVGNNMAPFRSDTIWLVQNGCSFHGLWFEDPNQHLKDFFKLMDSLDLDGENREERNFTYVIDFMIVKDISSIIDPRLSQVVLGRPFIEVSNMTHDLPKE
nr:hypothetical protein [Tanacetum cinerariifolium]